jgi:hypothetical protein
MHITRFQFFQRSDARFAAFFGEASDMTTAGANTVATARASIPLGPFRELTIDHRFAGLHITCANFRHIQGVAQFSSSAGSHLDQARAGAIAATAGHGTGAPFHPIAPHAINHAGTRLLVASFHFPHDGVARFSEILRLLNNAPGTFSLPASAGLGTYAPIFPAAEFAIHFMITGEFGACLHFFQIALTYFTSVLLFCQNSAFAGLLATSTCFVALTPRAPIIEHAVNGVFDTFRDAFLRFHTVARAWSAAEVVRLFHGAMMITQTFTGTWTPFAPSAPNTIDALTFRAFLEDAVLHFLLFSGTLA